MVSSLSNMNAYESINVENSKNSINRVEKSCLIALKEMHPVLRIVLRDVYKGLGQRSTSKC